MKKTAGIATDALTGRSKKRDIKNPLTEKKPPRIQEIIIVCLSPDDKKPAITTGRIISASSRRAPISCIADATTREVISIMTSSNNLTFMPRDPAISLS